MGYRLGKAMITIVTAVLLAAAMLWATAVALEPRSVGPAYAPDPESYEDAVIQVYGANVWGFRGRFAIHTWIATKAKGATDYRIYQVIGWRLRRGRSVVSVDSGDPARPWYGSAPVLLHDTRGDVAQELIDDVHNAALSYPFPDAYKMWPGPNSNSFTAWIALEVPELGLSLPTKALGKTWMINEHPELSAAR